jgi:glycosyltransferase involved in cell wall biosynthesis
MKVDADHVPTSLASSEKPMVSIVITAHNAERYIQASLKAALAQSYSNFEVVVVDDGSSDKTGALCAENTDPRLRYMNRGRLGRQRALNEGIAAAEGEYIAINDADDLSLPHRLAYSMDFFRAHPDLAFLGTGFDVTTSFGDAISDEILSETSTTVCEEPWWLSRVTVYCRNVFVHSTVVYPKSTWERIGGYDEQLTNSEDYDFYLRALQCGPAVLLPGHTVLWYTNPNGYFKQKNKREHLGALSFIKRRAHRLLNLPRWLRLYHPLWVVWFELVQRFPGLMDLARTMKKTLHVPWLTRWV